MRDLTKEELALAPRWAVSYAIESDGEVLFLSRDKRVVNSPGKGGTFCIGDYRHAKKLESRSLEDARSFDITKHESSDVDLCGVSWVDIQDALKIDISPK